MPANNDLSIGTFRKNSEEILNCSTACEPARQKPIAVGEQAGKLSNSRALMSRCDQCPRAIDVRFPQLRQFPQASPSAAFFLFASFSFLLSGHSETQRTNFVLRPGFDPPIVS